MTLAEAFAIVSETAARHALAVATGLRLELRYEGIGVDPFARVRFADGGGRYLDLDLACGGDPDPYRGIVEARIVRFRSAEVRL